MDDARHEEDRDIDWIDADGYADDYLRGQIARKNGLPLVSPCTPAQTADYHRRNIAWRMGWTDEDMVRRAAN